MMNERQQAAAADRFARQWAGRGYEKGESQTFWLQLLRDVLGVEHPEEIIRFEEQVRLDNTSFIDAHIPSTRVMIEQKSIGRSLTTPIPQSSGVSLTPYQQAQRYILGLPVSQHPRWVVTCNFAEFLIYDMERPNAEPQQILLRDLGREYYRLRFLVDTGSQHLEREKEVSLEAGEIVGRIYDALLAQYIDPTKPESMRSLNVLCVRLVFCLYAEDAGVLGRRDMFHDYLAAYPTAQMRHALVRLFHVLDTPVADRDPYLQDDLAAFPYVNGGLFHGDIEIPRLTDDIRQLLLQRASLDFDWSLISPTIFGAVFESTLNPETRRSGGMHYTSIENIHRVIDPLFLDPLTRELNDILETERVPRSQKRRLLAFQERLASLTFFDPACGSGNFLTETYLSLRRLENRTITALYGGQSMLGAFVDPIRVSIQQFYGIEINDFAVTVATTALWISEAQMLAETERIVSHDIDFLPLRSYSNIREGNALRIPWEEVVPPERLSHIIGNPPFIGARIMSPEQKDDLLKVFGPRWHNLGNMDYVCGWYKKAAELMKGTSIRTALVSTNSVAQGEQVANLWPPLMADGLRINFAHRTFRWDSEATEKAHVHCVIIGFSYTDTEEKLIYDNDTIIRANHINAYLANADDVFVGSRPRPLCPVPEIGIGNKPIDDGNYLFTREEMDDFVAREPLSRQYFRPWYGSYEFIHRCPRYCLWLGGCTPAELHRMPHAMKRVEAVRNYRLKSKSAGTRKLAERPTRFHVENMPDNDYIIIPSTSSERRRYIPMGFLSPENICSNAVHIIPSATLYHFGILMSNVHNAWMRAVCGRLEMRYRYSKDVVYNNFPWPTPTPEQHDRIQATAQAILTARDLYPDSTLADLYDPLTMPPELLRAHQDNDRAVMQAYAFPIHMTEAECVAALLQRYRELARQP